LNLLKKGLESLGKVLEFHLHQRVDTLDKYEQNKYICISLCPIKGDIEDESSGEGNIPALFPMW
jgi:hypothetical protein